jgi:hypothetical protein
MTIATQFAFFAVSAVVTPGDGPTDPPSDGFAEVYNDPPGFHRFRWTNGDATAYTRIYDGAVSPGNLIGTVDPGITSFNTTIPKASAGTANVTHFKNAIESAADSFTYGFV